MKISKFTFDTIVTAEEGMYLKPKGSRVSLGKPTRIIFSNKGDIPDLVELPLDTDETPTKTTRRKSKKQTESAK